MLYKYDDTKGLMATVIIEAASLELALAYFKVYVLENNISYTPVLSKIERVEGNVVLIND